VHQVGFIYKKKGTTEQTMPEHTHIRGTGDERHQEMDRNKTHKVTPNNNGQVYFALILITFLRKHILLFFFSKSVLVFQVNAFQNTLKNC